MVAQDVGRVSVLEALRDPLVQFVVLALLALAAVVVGILGLIVYRNRKRLSYKVILQERLLGVQEYMEGRVHVTFDGKPVHDVRMVILHLPNTGNVPIEESDYLHPLGFNFGSDASVLSAEVV